MLSIAHTAVSREAGRLRYEPLADDPGLDVHLVVPSRWHQFGRWQRADPAAGPANAMRLAVHILPIRLPTAGPAKWYMHSYPGLQTLVSRLDPEVIHLWEEPWSLVALQATFLRRRGCDAALVLEVDQNILKRLPPPFNWIRRYVLQHTTMVLSRSPEATSVVRACGYTGPVTPIGYGVDEMVFCPQGPAPASSPLRIGYVGRLVEEKGLDDALDGLARTGAPVHLALMGEGPHEPALRRRVRRLGLVDRVTFQGWGTPEAVASFLRGLHALVLLTRTDDAVREQFGRVILEAQACGVPVIGSTSGAIPDVVGAGGWIVPERDPATLAILLDHLAATPGELRRCSVAGRANIGERFTYPAIARTLARAWRSAAALHEARDARRARLGTPELTAL